MPKGKYARRRAARLGQPVTEGDACAACGAGAGDSCRRTTRPCVHPSIEPEERVADCHICGEPIDHCSGHSADEHAANPHPDDIDTGEWRRTLEAQQVGPLRDIAKGLGLKPGRTRKADLIDAIVIKAEERRTNALHG